MSNIPTDLLYTKEHEWVKQCEGESCLIGITHHAQDSLGDVTYVELPEVGQSFEKNEVFGVVESVKAASDLYMPISGEVSEINEDLNNSPEQVNSDPYNSAWMIKVKQSVSIGSVDLLTPEEYKKEIH